jgi:uncharacterized protein (TIGR02466 family)
MAFDIPLYHKNIDCDIDKIRETINSIISRDRDPKRNFSFFTSGDPKTFIRGDFLHKMTWDSNINVEEKIVLKNLVDMIENHAIVYWNQLKYDVKFKPTLRQAWINVLPKNAFVLSHTHTIFTISGSFYLFDNVAPIYFVNPLELIWLSQPFDRNTITNPLFGHALHEVINIKSKDLLLFPSWLKHGTLPNENDEDRISIGFNLLYDKLEGELI